MVADFLHYNVIKCTEFTYTVFPRKVRNLQIGVEKLVGKVLINLFHHTKPAACIISIIIDVFLLLVKVVLV